MQVYIIDTGAYSGGGEALYQLSNDLSNLGYRVIIVRLNHRKNPPVKFQKYLDKISVVNFRDLSQEMLNLKSIIITPESCTSILFSFPKATKYIWWLSYDYYDGVCIKDSYYRSAKSSLQDGKWKIKQAAIRFNNKLKYGISRFPIASAINLAGSYYATEQLTKMGLQTLPLFHSIGTDFLKLGMCTDKSKELPRRDIVLYNPAKPSNIMVKLLKRRRFQYIPIQNLQFNEMIDLFRIAKLYIDFGRFPGPERLPKETVFNGVNILVGRRNAAATRDVQIPEKYKIPMTTDIEQIEQYIEESLCNYYSNYKDYDEFRNIINNMENEYYFQLNNIFKST